MPLTADQKVCLKSETASGETDFVKSVTRNYRLKEYADRASAESGLLLHSKCPLVDPDYPYLVRKPFQVSSDPKISDEFLAEVTWERFSPEVVDREKLSGSISLTSQTIKTTYNHVGSYGPGSAAAMNAGGLINVTKDGAEGVELDIPVMTFTLTRLYTRGTFSLAWLANARTFCGLPNTSTWRGFSSGTIKLAGVDGREGDGDFDEISFSFQTSPTFTNLVIPSPLGNITVPQKLGWQYLHVQMVERHDDATGFTTQVAHTAHVDEITQGVDLNGLLS